MPRFSYTKAKGILESHDADIETGLFSVSDVPVIQSAAAAGLAPIAYIRIYNQPGNITGGDGYDALEDTLLYINDGQGNAVNYEFTPDGSAASVGTQLDISGAASFPNSTAAQIAAVVLAKINADFSTIEAVAQAAVNAESGGTATDSTDDYIDIYLYSAKTGTQIVVTPSTTPSTHIDSGVVVSGTPSSIDAGVYLAAGRADDETGLEGSGKPGSVDVGALSDGTSAGQMMFAMNNATNRTLKFTGSFTGSNTICTIGAGKGSLLVWDGTDWLNFKHVTGAATFSS